ncbi:hypothetical protein [Flammeovirga sp. EKP202]|uniref:hypothetical protein n=1 Tax=Flammeovirga sp. EKP202 TaxID=2770592 RepID=UPI00165F2B87|nr:hypothetical protein [Flammeovirga sp. EKP202]MBD0404007.1 hypothetical protein [Flammeovirga sp. EKP202]
MQKIQSFDVKTYKDILKYNKNLYIPFRKNALGQREYLSVLQIKVDLLKDEMYKYRRDLNKEEMNQLTTIGKRLQEVLLREKVAEVEGAPLKGGYFITSSPFNENLYSVSTFLDKYCPRKSFYDQVISSTDRSYKDNYDDVEINFCLDASASYCDDDIIDLRNEYRKQEYLAIHLGTGAFIKVTKEEETYKYLKELDPVSDIEPLGLEYKLKVPNQEFNGLLVEESYLKFFNKYAEQVFSTYRDDEAVFSIYLFSESFFETLLKGIEVLDEMHSRGEIHGNFYAGCIDFQSDQWVLKDSLNIKIGGVSPSKYDKYFAPEQLLLQGLDERTDVYFIGLVILNYIDALQFGKTSDYYIPDTNGNVKHQILLDEPHVFISPKTKIFEDGTEGRTKWRVFLEQCLAFDKNDRFNSIEELKSELTTLLEHYPISKVDQRSLASLGVMTDVAMLEGEVVYGYDV